MLTAAPELVRREAQIVAQAGMPGSVTLATNMAGVYRVRPVECSASSSPVHNQRLD